MTNEVEEKTNECEALGSPVNAHFQAHFFTQLAKSSGQTTLSILRARLAFLNRSLEKIASRGPPHLPAREPVVAQAESTLGRTVAISNSPGPSTNASVKVKIEAADVENYVKNEAADACGSIKRAPIKRASRTLKLGYSPCFKPNPDGTPCVMAALHVAFATFCAKRLRKNNQLRARHLVDLWNKRRSADWQALLNQRLPDQISLAGSGTADNFFPNGVFRIEFLQKMAQGTLPLPLPPGKLHPDIRKLMDARFSQSDSDQAIDEGGGDSAGEGGGGRGAAAFGGINVLHRMAQAEFSKSDSDQVSEESGGEGGGGRGAAAFGGAAVVSGAAAGGPAMTKRKYLPPADGREERDGAREGGGAATGRRASGRRRTSERGGGRRRQGRTTARGSPLAR